MILKPSQFKPHHHTDPNKAPRLETPIPSRSLADLEPRARLAATCPELRSPPPAQDKWVLFGVCAGCGSGTPLGERQLLCHRFPSCGRAMRQKALFVLGKVSGTRRAGAELGLFIGPEACRLRNAGSRLELAGSCLPRARPWSPQPARPDRGLFVA